MVFAPRYCCCAIPLVNVGMYALMTEQFVVCSVAGVLALATPTIVGSYVPSYTPYILATLCFVVAAIQLVGFFGIYREQVRTFRTYAWVNAFAFTSIFACGAALVAVSAARHNEAVARCTLTYFKGQSNDGTINVSGEAKTICSAFAWADIGIMGGAWLILLVGQVYFIFMIKVYASEQKVDHQEYKSIYEANAEEFAMIERNSQWGPNPDAWDPRESMDADPNAVPGSNMYEQPYSRPAHPAGGYSESSLKHEFSQEEHQARDYEYEQAQAQGQGYPPQAHGQAQGGDYDQYQQYPQQQPHYQQQDYGHQQEYGQQQQYQQGHPDEPQYRGQAQGGYHADGRQGGYRL